jgi:hypothetical protein
MVFGLSQIVWFLWIGTALLHDATTAPREKVDA